jgi:hypothetical protein
LGLPKGSGTFYSREEYLKAYSLHRPSRYYHQNKEKVLAKIEAWRKANPEKLYLYHLKQKFGLSAEKYRDMLCRQNNRCAICRKREVNKRLSVDHCHKTGRVRGLLCNNCNFTLGRFGDNSNLLRKAASYLDNI